MTYVFRKVIKMPQKARYPKCPECGEPKTAHEFRTSNRNLKRHPICYKCRKENPNAGKLFPANASAGRKRKEPFLVIKRRKSKFRKLFNSVSKTLYFRRKRKNKEVWMSVKGQAADYLKFPERVAAIVGKTYAVMGDDFKLADDEALTRIRDLLEELDPTLIARNKKKRLSR
jgi:hypothetical protein